MKILYIDAFYGFSRQMLLGAILDICDVSATAEGQKLCKQKVLRSSIECVSALACDARNTDTTAAAIVLAIRELAIDYVMCSPIPLGDDADGDVIAELEKGGAQLYPSDSGAWILPEEAVFLSSIVAEHGNKPPMNITGVGYGADTREDKAFLCVVVGESNSARSASVKQHIFLDCQA